jgi:hypothetical protein
MLNRLRSLYADWKQGRRTEPDAETEPRSDPSPRSAAPDDGTGAGERGTDPAKDGASGSWHDVLDGEQVSKGEVRMELGLQPYEFLAWLVRHSGGRMWQSDIVETTGWSKSTVSRYLDSLESSDTVERIRIGRQKLVAVPGRMPDPVASADHAPAADSPSDDPAAGAWSPEAD